MSPDVDNAYTGSFYFFRFAARSQWLASPARARRFTTKLVKDIGCRIIDGPHVVHVPEAIRKTGEDPYADEGGVSALATLSTSHTAYHSWPTLTDKGKVNRKTFGTCNIIVYSCRPFEWRDVVDVIIDLYEPSWVDRYECNHVFDEEGGIQVYNEENVLRRI